MMIVQHVLVFCLIVVMPLWDWYEIPRLKASTVPGKKIRFYGKIVAASWALAVVAVITVGVSAVFVIRMAPREIAWLAAGSPGSLMVKGVTAGMLIAILLPAAFALWSKKIRAKAAKAMKRFAFLLPSTADERRWWWLICITAGVCEEIVYRGFLLQYLHVLPFHLSLTWAVASSSVIFGIGHLYQGISGSVQTALIGCVLGAMFLVTGNLLLPIVVHVLLDLRLLALLPEGFETTA